MTEDLFKSDGQGSTAINPMKRRKVPYVFICVATVFIALAFVAIFNFDLIKRKLRSLKPMKTEPKKVQGRLNDDIRIEKPRKKYKKTTSPKKGGERSAGVTRAFKADSRKSIPFSQERELWAKVVEILQNLGDLPGPDSDLWEREAGALEAAIDDMGPWGFARLEELLPEDYGQRYPLYSPILYSILRRQDQDIVDLIARILRKKGWMPEQERWKKIVEILQTLNTPDEMSDEEVDRIWREAEKSLLALGPWAIPQLEPLLHRPNEKGFPEYSEKLMEILGREDDEAVDLIVHVMKKHRWVSNEEIEKRANLLDELPLKVSDPRDLATRFAELGWFGVEALRGAFYGSEDATFRLKVVEILDRVSKQVPLAPVEFLLDLLFDESVEVKRKALSCIADIAYEVDKDNFQKLDKILKEEKAYVQLVGFLRLDPDPEIRMLAARALGNLEYKEAAQELINALNDRKERVQGEVVGALLVLAHPIVKDDKTDFDVLVRSLRSWWNSARFKFPEQIKAAPPVRPESATSPAEEAYFVAEDYYREGKLSKALRTLEVDVIRLFSNPLDDLGLARSYLLQAKVYDGLKQYWNIGTCISKSQHHCAQTKNPVLQAYITRYLTSLKRRGIEYR
jgi:hypothetical protein